MNSMNKFSSTSRSLARAALIFSIAAGIIAAAGCSKSSSPDGSSAASAACEGSDAWPKSALTVANATTVDPAQFISEAQLESWGYELDSVGLRATGNKAHEAYIDRLAARLRCAGVTDVGFEKVPLEQQWLAKDWSLSIADGPSAGPVRVASYVPYSGITATNGLTAPMVYLDANTAATPANAAGKIVLFDAPRSTLPVALFGLYGMGLYGIDTELTKLYKRPFLSNEALEARLAEIEKAGAAGTVVMTPEAYESVVGTYAPYDGILRKLPSVYVDKVAGAQLKAAANGTAQATLKLTATVKAATTRNIVAFIPGMSDELTVIHSHTDGTNSIEDNGPDAIIGIAQYLSRLPREALPRSVMILMSAGHFTGGSAIKAFLKEHASDGFLDRIASITTIEHLGAQEWEPDSNGVIQPTGNAELGAFFMPPIKAFADAGCDWFLNADAGAGAVLKPLNPNGSGDATDSVWPGEGQYFYALAGIPTANYITGPYYLLSWGITAADKTDFDRMRKQMIAFAQMQLDVSSVSKAALATEGIAVSTIGSGKYLGKGVCLPTPIPVSIPLP